VLRRLTLLIHFFFLIVHAHASGVLQRPLVRPQFRSALTAEPAGSALGASPSAHDLTDDEFSRQTIALGRSAQQRLMRSHVAVAVGEAMDPPNAASMGAIDRFNRDYGLLDEVVRNLALCK
jgi:hypothetical protein